MYHGLTLFTSLSLDKQLTHNPFVCSFQFSAGWRTDPNRLAIAAPTGTNENSSFAEKLGTIKSAQNKELLIGLSGVINLVTFTEAKGNNLEGEVTAVADSSVQGKVVLIPSDSEEVSTVEFLPQTNILVSLNAFT